MNSENISKKSFLDIWVNDFTLKELLAKIEKLLAKGNNAIIGHHNLHSLYLYHVKKEVTFVKFYTKTDFILVDGMSLVFLSRLFGCNLDRVNRITYVDLINPLLSLLNKKNSKLYYLGGTQEVVDKTNSILGQKYENIEFLGHSGYFDMRCSSSENEGILNQIRKFQPDILMVGMGMPRQEKWIYNNLQNIEVPLIMDSGACFDYFTGLIPTPPRSFSRYGLEWLFRFLHEPKRLFSRYFKEPILLLPIILKKWIRTKVK